jgi:hypothetical protein
MVLIQLLLPVPTSATGAEADERVAQTRHELVEAFGGITAYLRTPAHGVWTAPDGARERDAVVMVEIVTERFDRAWWHRYASAVAARFQQDAIHVRAVSVDVL